MAYPEVSVSGYAADGSVAVADQDALSFVGAGQTVWRTLVTDGTDVRDGEVVPVAVKAYQLDTVDSVSTFSVSDVAVRDGVGGLTVTGRVTLEEEGDDVDLTQGVTVCVVLRDGSGAVVAAGQGYLDGRPARGRSSTFQVDVYADVDYASCDVCAYGW